MDEFLAAWNSGARNGVFEAEKFQTDITRSPVPRYDLINWETTSIPLFNLPAVVHLPANICDIIELYGRVPRHDPEQILGGASRLFYRSATGDR